MKICVVAQRVPYPPNKGEKLRTFHQIERMVQLGHDVDVISFSESEQDTNDALALQNHLQINVSTFPLGSKLTRYASALIKQQPVSVGAFYQGDVAKRIDDILKNGSVDVLYLTASSLGQYVFSSSHFSDSACKVMMDFMDVDSDKWHQYANSSSWPMRAVYIREAKGIRKLEQKANAQFEKTFLIAEEEVALFRREVSDAKPVNVMGNGLDFSAFYPAENKSSDATSGHFLFTGVMDYKPNIDAVMWFVKSCWPDIRRALPDAVFTIAGMNPSTEIQSLNGKNGIDVTGFVDDILPYFHSATAFVAPFRIARGVQNKVLQAAACKLPVITTSMGAEGIHFASEQTMFIENDTQGFTDACIRCVKEPDTAAARAQKGLDEIKSAYSWEQQLKPLEEALGAL